LERIVHEHPQNGRSRKELRYLRVGLAFPEDSQMARQRLTSHERNVCIWAVDLAPHKRWQTPGTTFRAKLRGWPYKPTCSAPTDEGEAWRHTDM